MWRPIETSPISRQRPGESEAEVVVPVTDVAPVAAGRPNVPRTAETRTAPENATTTIAGFPHIRIGRRARIALVPAIFNPLVYIAVYIVEAKTVRGITPYRNRLVRKLSRRIREEVGLGGAGPDYGGGLGFGGPKGDGSSTAFGVLVSGGSASAWRLPSGSKHWSADFETG